MNRALAALTIVLTLAACATPAVQPPLTPPPGFAGPALEARALVMDDGARLPLVRWAPEGEPGRGRRPCAGWTPGPWD